MTRVVRAHTYVDGTSTIRCEVLENGYVRLELIAGKTASLSGEVLRQLADLADGVKR